MKRYFLRRFLAIGMVFAIGSAFAAPEPLSHEEILRELWRPLHDLHGTSKDVAYFGRTNAADRAGEKADGSSNDTPAEKKIADDSPPSSPFSAPVPAEANADAADGAPAKAP